MNELDGATTTPPENQIAATPGEFAARWNAHTDEERQQWLDAMRAASERSMRCFIRDHEGYITALEALVLRVQALTSTDDGGGRP